MIISYKHKFIFVAIPKTAGHAIRSGLRRYLDKNDWEQCTLFEKRFFPVETLARLGHGHLSYEQIRPFLLPGVWNDYFTFAFVRNPYDRFLSFCYFRYHDSPLLFESPLSELKRIFHIEKSKNGVLFRPQYKFLCDDSGVLRPKFVGRYESLQTDFERVCKQLAIPSQELPFVNSSSKAVSKDDMDGELEEMLYEHFQRDFRLFGYERLGT